MEQLQNTEIKAPLLVKTIAIFILIAAIGTVWKGFFEFFFPGISHSALSGIWVLVYGIGLIFVALDIRRMRRWALYALTVVIMVSIGRYIYLLLTYPSGAPSLVNQIIYIAVLGYLWSLFKKFNNGSWMEVFRISNSKLILVCISLIVILLLIFFGGQFLNTILCSFINCGPK